MTLEKGNTFSLKLKIHHRERLDSEALNLTPKSTELQRSRLCHVVMPGERQLSARRSPQTPPQRWALSKWQPSPPRSRDVLYYISIWLFCFVFWGFTNVLPELPGGFNKHICSSSKSRSSSQPFNLQISKYLEKRLVSLHQGSETENAALGGKGSEGRADVPAHCVSSEGAHLLFSSFNKSRSSSCYLFQVCSEHRYKETEHHLKFHVSVSPQKGI